MYENPISAMYSDIAHKIVKDEEEHLMLEIQQVIGYAVDKDELVKALRYDRNQYEKGYEDAKQKYEKMLDKLADFLEGLELNVPCDCLVPISDECEKQCHYNIPTKECWIKWAEKETEE